MKEKKICQSCGRRMHKESLGRHADGSVSDDYCEFCYKEGEFYLTYDEIFKDCSYVPDEFGDNLSPDDLKKEIRDYLLKLERWHYLRDEG